MFSVNQRSPAIDFMQDMSVITFICFMLFHVPVIIFICHSLYPYVICCFLCHSLFLYLLSIVISMSYLLFHHVPVIIYICHLLFHMSFIISMCCFLCQSLYPYAIVNRYFHMPLLFRMSIMLFAVPFIKHYPCELNISCTLTTAESRAKIWYQ